MKNVIITGGTGFFGINLVEELLEKGYYLTVTVRQGSEHNKRLPDSDRLTVLENDIEEIERLPGLLKNRFGKSLPVYDTFYHLAWRGGRNDMAAQLKNVNASLKALESASALGCSRFICSGSQAEYGVKQGIITEEEPCFPVNAYGAAKASACFLTRVRAEQLGIGWIWGRIFSLIGKYEPFGRMLPDLIEKLKKGEEAGLSSCEQYWDYLDAKDAARAFILLGEKGRDGEIYNVAAGARQKLKEYVRQTADYFNKDAAIVYGDDPKPFISLRPSVEKLEKDTGWSPQIDFKRSLKWYT